MVGVSSRTRSKNVPLFGSIPFHGSCACSLKSNRRKSDIGLSSKKRKPNEEPFVLHEGVDVIPIDSDKEGDEEPSVLKFSEACAEQVENFGNGDADEVGDEAWLEYLNKNKFEVGDIDVKNEEQSGDIVGEGGLEDCEINSFEGCVNAADDNGEGKEAKKKGWKEEEKNMRWKKNGPPEGVSSRTRSKNVLLFGSLSFHGSGSLESKKRKPNEESFVLHEDDDVIRIGSDEEGDEEGLKFSDKKFSQSCVDNGDVEGFEDCERNNFEGCVDGDADADEVGDEDWLRYCNKNKFEGDIDVENEEQSGDSVDNGGEGGLENCERNRFEGCIGVENEVEREKNGGLGDLVEKDEIFDDEKCGLISENMIIGSDHESDDDKDDGDDQDEGGLKNCENNSFEGCVGVENEAVSEKNGGIGELAEKDESFDDEECGLISENLITDSEDESEYEDESDDDDDDDEDDEDEYDESEEIETSDEEFQVDEVNEVSDSDNSSSSYADDDDDNGEEKEAKKKGWRKKEEEEEVVVVEEEVEKDVGLGMVWQECDNELAEMVGQNNEISERNNALNKKVSYVPMEAPSSSSKLHQASKGMQMKEKNVSDDDDDDDNVYVGKTKSKSKSKAKESVIIGDFDEEEMQSVQALGVNDESDSSIQTKQKEMKSSEKQKMTEMKGSNYKGRASSNSGEKKESVELCLNQRGKSTVFMPKELRLRQLLAEYYWGNKNSRIQNDSPILEMKDVIWRDTRSPPVCNETAPLIWSLKKVEKVQKTKTEEEEEVLWDIMDTSLRELDAESMIGNLGTNEVAQEKIGSSSPDCDHDIRLDEEIGVYCRRCGWVVTDIKDVSPQVVDKYPYEGSGQRASFGDANVSHFQDSHFNVSDNDSGTNFSFDERTVWDLIPDVKQTLYSHQQEGFEFIWNKLVGNIELQALKNANLQREGGCIISHAPGTGKTKLTIMFLKAYLKVFPKCLPVIVAPAGLLLTWEDEFKKWDIGVPFHNLNNPELSVKEHDDVVNATNWSNTRRHSTEETRMAKLILWFKETSILGISYTLFKDLAHGEEECKDKKKNNQKRKENSYMRKALLEAPGLLVLDEGHTPRNARSRVWKVLSKIQTKKRIMLSGTPFQNNFLELYNTFSIVKPSFPNTIPPKLKKFCLKHKEAARKWSWEPVTGNSTTGNPSDDKIKHLKLLMDPFVHVYKGAILQKKLFGLRDCVLRLKPDSFQKQILESIKISQNILNFEHKLALASVHPSLFLESKLLEEEESVVDKERLEKVRLDPHVGVKAKFLVEFVNLCNAVNEKVLVFSQFIPPLRLIVEQLNSIFNWAEGKEILYMDGMIDLKEKQSLIHNFNDANSKAKILLACTKACSEGISLIGASRVVLLDVVWNPSVERQAISRAYRIGQKRTVYTYHLLTHETSECVKYFKQAEKDRLSELVFSDNDKGKNRAVNLEDGILDLMLQHKKLKDMFVECVVQPKERDLVESYYY
ncbi:SNF2 domain-containing protein CLASSY 4-like [Vicia villosa]|uniref:SNF2 domain-containing protein CLASSY 4-like n=1 Tax=Vicia villosa TaxID=3911 RepID=UPI00273B5C66|nr:SNF2 domain-containing protein CLASSY 4-like [Vicia villosa]